ncbi:MAG TPA: gamma-glutamyl-gamma-aminobutyrate hydrolase family protein, partial [Bdellovibrionota bacterium]|nr:gamma-glutamyl-gamma-aminobutyrate hydrolase family protein [Bdellovibrionota bacterium]
IEFARNVCNLKNATSREFGQNENHTMVIDLMESQKGIENKGGTMRLGSYACSLKKGSKSQKAYGKEEIQERHRHRFEVNNDYVDQLQKGLTVAGRNEQLNLVEMIEITSHPWFVACQFHPEFKSRPWSPHPLFAQFVRSAVEKKYGARLSTSKRPKKQKLVARV